MFSQTTPQFWKLIDQLIENHALIIDRPKGSAHPRYPDHIYPLDYGYLEGTNAADGDGMDVWVGSLTEKRVQGLACTIDMVKRDMEIKLLVDTTEVEMQIIIQFLNGEVFQCLLLRRETD
jgi:inorganic pyrophosphatase